mmetsp:Transcript_40307/g.91569  ORF Transcript_40307/g.91569 Transcript_40307/m.91569 type:complete len:303 (+) Transcript_40307:136-1044(+)
MMMFSLLPSSACRVQLKLPLQTVVPSITQNLWCMLPPAPSMRTSNPAARSSFKCLPPFTNIAWRSSVMMRTRTPRAWASRIAFFSSATVSVKTATSKVLLAELTSATMVLKFTSSRSGKNSTAWSPCHCPVGAGPGSPLLLGENAFQSRSNSAAKAAEIVEERLTTKFSRLLRRAPVVQLKEPFTVVSPSTMANLWCMWNLLRSSRTSMPAFLNLSKSEVSKAFSASLSASTRTLMPALWRSKRAFAKRSSVSMKSAASRVFEAEPMTSKSTANSSPLFPGLRKTGAKLPFLLFFALGPASL